VKSAGLSHVLLLSVCVACAHAKTAANPRQEERAAQSADNEPSQGEGQPPEKGEAADDSATKSDGRASATGEQASRRDGDRKDTSDDKAKGDGEGKSDDVAPEDIEVSTSPQGLLEPGAMDKVREKLGVAKGESVQTALRRFQREHDLPATGMLDNETVERLGLSPDEIFEQAAR
jgi:hypothetical protein